MNAREQFEQGNATRLTAKERKRYDERVRETKTKIAALLAAKRNAGSRNPASPAPRYDSVFAEGVAVMNGG